MARRIDIELTSAQPDGAWTWRAAGARQPRGVLGGDLLYEGAKVGDVVRAEADFDVEGITVLQVLPPKERKRAEPERLEIIGQPGADAPGVTTQLIGRRGGGGDRERRDDRGGRVERTPGRDDRSPRRDQRGAGAGAPPRSGRPPSAGGPTTGERPQRRDRPAVPAGRERTPDRPRPEGDDDRRPRAAAHAGEPARRRDRRLTPGRAHRDAVLASLAPEEQPVADQVLRGGIPAVRTAINLEREKAVAEGRTAPASEGIISLAESLLPRLKTAEWHDRADAVVAAEGQVALRDLRSVVAGADAARDDETRALASRLREQLDTRLNSARNQWTTDIGNHLDEHRTVRALRLAGRPPEPSTQLTPELTERLVTVTNAALIPDTKPEQWMALLEASAAAPAPIRRALRPVGLPADADPALKRAAHQASSRIPALVALLGIRIPPPPGPLRPTPPRPPGGSSPAPSPGTPPAAPAAEVDAAAPVPAPADPEPTAAPETAAGYDLAAEPEPAAETATGSDHVAEPELVTGSGAEAGPEGTVGSEFEVSSEPVAEPQPSLE